MTKRRIHFLSGLPRTGSTLLGSLLNQNPNIHVSPTSPLYSLLVNANEHLNLLDVQYTFDKEAIGDQIYRSIVNAFYPEDSDFPVAFDKHRGWPRHVDAIRQYVDSDPRIVCTVRPIVEIIASYITLADRDPNNFIDAHLKKLGTEITNESRSMLLWTDYLKVPYECMTIGLKMHTNSLLLVEYDDLVFSPQNALHRIYEFCGIKAFDHYFEGITNTCSEAKDHAWGMASLHDIRPTISRASVDPLRYLPQSAIDYFAQFDLTGAWHG